MKKMGWSCVLITSRSCSKVRQIGFSGLAFILFAVISVSGIVGMVRLVKISSSYVIAKFGVYEARRENEGLLSKVKFLGRFMAREADKIEKLVEFEDAKRLQYGLNKISSDVRQAGVGGLPESGEMMLTTLLDPVLLKAEAVKESIIVLLRRAELQDSTFSQMTNCVEILHKQWSQRPSIWPTNGRITSPFGYRFHPIVKENVFHEGIDLANKVGTPVYATADGVVEFVGMRDNYGRVIILKHNEYACETIYAHLNQAAVNKNQSVKRGELIGHMGNSGRSTGSHLHYEVRTQNRTVNPLSYILPTDAIVD
ncbi:MAG TPA: M23 family metallopeptidase, partial [Chitinispirillaceae bacterium]|nr:M23 family metallopeptidase [Chitinispirillaceae bacterium]